MLFWYFSNNLDIYDYVGKLLEQHFRVWLFSNPGGKILFLLEFNEARISEWNVPAVARSWTNENRRSRVLYLFPWGEGRCC